MSLNSGASSHNKPQHNVTPSYTQESPNIAARSLVLSGKLLDSIRSKNVMFAVVSLCCKSSAINLMLVSLVS